MVHTVHICIQWVAECAQLYAVLTVWSGKGNLCLNLENRGQAPEGFFYLQFIDITSKLMLTCRDVNPLNIFKTTRMSRGRVKSGTAPVG